MHPHVRVLGVILEEGESAGNGLIASPSNGYHRTGYVLIPQQKLLQGHYLRCQVIGGDIKFNYGSG